MRRGRFGLWSLALFACLSWWSAARGEASVRSDSLGEVVSQPRWLSLPGSRLVLNPRFTGYGPDPSRGDLPTPLSLSLAYYIGEEPVRLPEFWSWGRQAADAPAVRPGPILRLDQTAAPDWQAEGVAPRFGDEGLGLTVTASGYGRVTRPVTVNLDQTPLLMVDAVGGTGRWAAKVNAGDGAPDVPLILDTDRTGPISVDVGAATGWRGLKTFQVVLFAVGGTGKTATFKRLQFFGRPDRLQSALGETVWFPHQIVARAETSGNEMRVESTTFLPDAATVAQRLRVVGSDGAALRLTGQFAEGSVDWDPAHRTLTLRGDRFQVRLGLSRPARWLGVRSPWPGGAEGVRDGTGAWALALEGVKPGDQIVVTAQFTPTAGGPPAPAAWRPETPPEFAQALRRQEAAWDRRLADVPQPQDFALHGVRPLGVGAADVRRTYYGAWVFLLSNILPPMPENGFPYPQCATGKPSLWSEGAPHARASAQWESFVAMQSLALVDPHTAWGAYEGLMSLVGPDGSLNGEGLPSCHAQTAWCLYEATGDATRLRRIYPALKRMLLWKASDPRWILHGATPPGQKDQQFVFRALVDMGYAGRIARALGMPGEERFWQTRRQALAEDFGHWFWEKPGGVPYRIYDATTGKRSGAGGAWNLTALSLPPDVLTGPERDSLLASFRAQWRPDLPFLIAGLSRFTDYQGTMRGVFQDGLIAEAAMMAAVSARDVTRAGEFSEVYDQNVAPPRPSGVRPSVFGARHVLDGVLWQNGVVCDEGLPVLIGMPGAGGVTGLRVQGEPIQVTYSGDHGVELEGQGLRHLSLPPGFRSVRTPGGLIRWQGTIHGAEVRLQDVSRVR